MPSIQRLHELDRGATPAPWHLVTDEDLVRNESGDVEWPAHLGDKFPAQWDYYLGAVDAELVVALRNSLPHLFKVIDAARGLAAAWGGEGVQQARAKLNAALQQLEEV